MLEIFANNKRLQLPEDVQVDMTFENPFLITDRIPATHSMSFDLPPTRENLQATGHANRIAAAGEWDELASRIVFNNITVSQGELMLQETEKSLKFNYVGSQFQTMAKKMMRNIILDKNDFGSGAQQPDFASGWSLAYKNAMLAEAKDIGTKFAACPVRFADEKWLGASNINGNYNALKLYLNMWNVNDGNFMFTSGAYPVHGSIFPQPYIHYLLDLVLGSNLNTNFFKDDAELKTLCMITSYHAYLSPDNLLQAMSDYRGAILDNILLAPKYFYLSSFFNNYHFNEFLKNMLKIFCCSLMPRPDGKWDVLHNKTILENTEVVDWSDKLAGTPVLYLQKAQSYDYGYSAESAEKDGTYTLIDSIEDLMSLLTPEGTFKISTTGEIFEKKLDETEETYVYTRVASGLGIKEKSEDDRDTYDMKSDVSPVNMRVDDFWWLDLNMTKWPWYVPEFSGDRKNNRISPQIGFMRGFYNISTKQIDAEVADYANHYPLLTPYNYDQAGNKIGNISLAWDGADGLLAKYHTEFKAYIEQDHMMLRAPFRLTELDLKNLDYSKKIYIRGKKYYVKKIETTMRKRSISLSRCELMEA